MIPQKITQLRRAGLSLIPIRRRDKKPLIPWKAFQSRHPTDEEVQSWFTGNELCNVAIVTGSISGVVVLDIDHHEGVDGAEILRQRGLSLPRTPTVKTGSGLHYYFKQPTASIPSQVALFPGVDVRGEGGYVVCPPSVHANGSSYEWLISLGDAELAELPTWVETSFKNAPSTRVPPSPPVIESDENESRELRNTAYGLAALEEEAETVRQTGEGKRNQQLFISAARSGRLVRDSHLKSSVAFAELLRASVASGLPIDEAKATIISGLKAGVGRRREHSSSEFNARTDELVLERDHDLLATLSDRLRSVFERDEYYHRPSDECRNALLQIGIAILQMARNELGGSTYVSCLAPGTGKTTAMTQAVKCLCTDQRFSDVGVIIFLQRLDEIARLVMEIGLDDDEFGVLTSDDRANLQGRQDDKRQAKVLFTTQQQLMARSKGTSKFADIDCFWFRQQSRSVRIWDEAIEPSEPLTLARYDLESLKSGFSIEGEPGLVEEIESFCEAIRGKSGHVSGLPNARKRYTSTTRIRRVFRSSSEKFNAETLWRMSGRTVRLRQKELKGETLISYEDVLPPDLAPLLVLDASALHRTSYHLWKEHRGGLRFLPYAQKAYDGLRIFSWDKGAGKTSQWRDEEKVIAEGVAKTINQQIAANEPVLVVHFKPADDLDFELDLKERLKGTSDRVRFCTWGRHTATNEFAHIKHIILVGVLAYSNAQYEATLRAARGAKPTDEFSDEELEQVRFGEIAHHLFQAANRGNIRKSEGNKCPEGCCLYLVASSNAAVGVPVSYLERIFPGAEITDWRPVFRPSPVAQKVIEYLLDANFQCRKSVKKADISRHLGVKESNSYVNRLLRNLDLIGVLGENGLLLRVGRSDVELLACPKSSEQVDKLFDRLVPWAEGYKSSEPSFKTLKASTK